MLEKEYWKDPIKVMQGLTWLIAGIVIGFLIGQI